MAASLPIICSDCGGGAEVVRDYGQLFPFGNVNALAQRLQHQSRIGDLERLSLRANARLKEKFSDERAQHSFFALPAISTLIAQPVGNLSFYQKGNDFAE
jgi:glycosyltransferase involved in cell wall biosynthesis